MTEKSPAFQFYPKDWLSDSKVLRMDMEERGMYIHLISICWLEGTIPNDPKEVCNILGVTSDYTIEDFNVSWNLVKRGFDEHPTDPSRLVHPRLEKEREKQKKWRDKCSEAGKMSGKARKEKAKSNSKGSSTSVEPNTNTSVFGFQSSSSNKNNRGENPENPKPELLGDPHDQVMKLFTDFENNNMPLKNLLDRAEELWTYRESMSRSDCDTLGYLLDKIAEKEATTPQP